MRAVVGGVRIAPVNMSVRMSRTVRQLPLNSLAINGTATDNAPARLFRDTRSYAESPSYSRSSMTAWAAIRRGRDSFDGPTRLRPGLLRSMKGICKGAGASRCQRTYLYRPGWLKWSSYERRANGAPQALSVWG